MTIRRIPFFARQISRRGLALSATAFVLLSCSAQAQTSSRYTARTRNKAAAATGVHYAGITTQILSSVSAGSPFLPEALAFDPAGNLLVADQGSDACTGSREPTASSGQDRLCRNCSVA